MKIIENTKKHEGDYVNGYEGAAAKAVYSDWFRQYEYLSESVEDTEFSREAWVAFVRVELLKNGYSRIFTPGTEEGAVMEITETPTHTMIQYNTINRIGWYRVDVFEK